MAWTSPRTWVANEILTAALLNAHVRDNLLHLYSPPTTVITSTTAYTTTATSYVDVNAALQGSLVTTGGRVLVIAQLQGTNVAAPRFLLNGVEMALPLTIGGQNVLIGWTDALAAGTHAVKPQWYATTGTATMTRYYLAMREVT